MQSLLNELPGKHQLTGLLDGKFSPTSLGVDGLQELKADDLQREVSAAAPAETSAAVAVPALPNTLTKDGFMGQLNGPLAKVGAVNRSALVGQVTSNPLPVSLPQPTFDVNGVMGKIADTVIPAKVSTPSSAPSVGWMDPAALLAPIQQLKEAGATTPIRLLTMMLKIVESVKNTVTDPAKMVGFTSEALAEIYVGQLTALRQTMPLSAVNEAIALLEGGYLTQYERALGLLAAGQADQFHDLGRAELLPGLGLFGRAGAALAALQAKETAALRLALKQVLDFGATDEVFLQPYFDDLTASSVGILKGIAGPVSEFAAMASKIDEYLRQAAAQAEQAARNVADALEKSIGGVNGMLGDLEQQITAVSKQVQDFLAQVDVGPVVTQIKDGCNQLGRAIEGFFTKVEELKLKLDTAVANVQGKVDDQLTKVFKQLEDQIRLLLGKISEVLARPEVKQALDQARQGIEEFKAKIGDASLKPVFDLVIEQTTKLEGNVRGLDVARMGTPQKTALKVGAKIIQAVKVDEIVKPELIEAFRQIQEPLQELIRLLKENVLVVERMIDEFNPGTIATDAILNSGPYQLIISTLDELRPSKLLEPLKQANAELTRLVARLDPQALIDELQRLYGRLAELVDTLAPESLNKLINGAIDRAVGELDHIAKVDIVNIVKTIKSTISLERLLAGTGLQEIADAEFWTLAKHVLGGGYLDEIGAAMTTIEERLAAAAATLVLKDVKAEIDLTRAAFQAELAADAKGYAARLDRLNALLGEAALALTRCQEQRAALAARYDLATGTGLMLRDLDLAPLAALAAGAAAAAALSQAKLGPLVTAAREPLKAEEPRMLALSERDVQNVAARMFKRQFGDPIRAYVAAVRAELAPFAQAIEAIQRILRTLAELPAKIDAAVGNILNTLQSQIQQTIAAVIKAIEATRAAIIGAIKATYELVKRTVEAFSPAWLLNAFAASDFAAGGLAALAAAVRAPGDDRIMALVQARLTSDQLELLRNDPAGTVSAANQANIVAALNGMLRETQLASRATLDDLAQRLGAAIKLIADKPFASRTPEEIRNSYRYGALKSQLERAWADYDRQRASPEPLLRLNRIIFEARYPDDIGMSLQSLHPFILEEIAHLYPAETVARLDDIYAKIIAKIKQLPDQLIRRPLDDEFKSIKTTLRQSFDISGLFTVLELKLDGLDDDLEAGLDRLSHSYNQLLSTLDSRLAA